MGLNKKRLGRGTLRCVVGSALLGGPPARRRADVGHGAAFYFLRGSSFAFASAGAITLSKS
jgi:hypothetical protein